MFGVDGVGAERLVIVEGHVQVLDGVGPAAEFEGAVLETI
jgi:hypothetical protein